MQISWGQAPAQLWLVGLSSTNTGSFQISSSCCWPAGHLQACLDASLADLVGESKFWAVTSIFKWCKNWICMNFERRCYRPKYCSSLGPLFQSFIGLWVKLRHKNNPIPKSCRAADLSQGHVQEKGICSDSNWKAQPQPSYLRWQCKKDWQQPLTWTWIDCNQSLPTTLLQTNVMSESL